MLNKQSLLTVIFLLAGLPVSATNAPERSGNLSNLKQNQQVSDFRVDHLYSDPEGKIVAAKFVHVATGAPVFLLQLETAPQLLTWVNSPTDSNKGLAHALEHLLILKGTKGR